MAFMHRYCCCGGCPDNATLEVTFSNLDAVNCGGCYGAWYRFQSASGFDGTHTVSRVVPCAYSGSPGGTLLVDVYSDVGCVTLTGTDTYNSFGMTVTFDPSDGSILDVALAQSTFSMRWQPAAGTKFLGDTIDQTDMIESCGVAWNTTNPQVVVSAP